MTVHARVLREEKTGVDGRKEALRGGWRDCRVECRGGDVKECSKGAITGVPDDPQRSPPVQTFPMPSLERDKEGAPRLLEGLYAHSAECCVQRRGRERMDKFAVDVVLACGNTQEAFGLEGVVPFGG